MLGCVREVEEIVFVYPYRSIVLAGFFLEYNFRGGKSTFLEIEGVY